MKRILLDYDEVSGELMDANGAVPCYYQGLVGFEQEKPNPQSQNKVSELLNLKMSGFEAQEILELKDKGLL